MRRSIAVFDLDGTICNNDHRKHLAESKQWDAFNAACPDDTVRYAEAAIACAWVMVQGHEVVYCTGRSDDRRAETVRWLALNGIPAGPLLMRRTGDHRDDSIVKEELLRAYTDLESVAFVMEDRARVVAMWRSLGLTCLQCQPGDF